MDLLSKLLIYGAVLAITFGIGWHYGQKGPATKLAKLEAIVAADNAERERARKAREAEDERNGKVIAATQAAEFVRRNVLEAQLASARSEVAALVVRLRDSPAARCDLPGDARRLWDGAADGGRGAAESQGAPAGSGTADGAQAPAAPVDCVTVYETGFENTQAATYNAEALNACWAEAAERWELRTGERFNWGQYPWLRHP